MTTTRLRTHLWKSALLLLAISGFTAEASVSDIVTKALAFKSQLTSTQQSTLQQNFSNALAVKWSNLPCGATCRNGIQFTSLTAPQIAAAMEVITAASGLAPNEGVAEFTQTRWADSVLNASGGGSNYGPNIFFLAYLNTPSTTGAWMLQFGGHHFAINIAFNNGQVVGVTPNFKGIEPLTFVAAGVPGTQAPLNQEQAGLVTMLDSLTPTQLASAKVSTTFTDIVMGAGKDSPFPTAKIGLAVSTLSSTQQAAVLAAMEPYILDMDSASAATMRALYASEINQTYIAWSGASSKLLAQNDYARIDGPSVWIELTCQGGIVIKNQIHYHTIWRDRTRDYGQYLAATSLTGSTGVHNVSAKSGISFTMNATGSKIRLLLAEKTRNATITVLDIRGKSVIVKKNVNASKLELNIASLNQGSYFVKIEQKGQTFSSKFVKL